jgi:protein-disulfide isomerase
MLTQKVEVNSEQGKKMVSQFGLKILPAFIFSKDIEKTELFVNAEPFLDKQGEAYALKSGEAGFPIGKYIVQPTIGVGDIKIGSDEAKVKIVEFSDFSNPTDAKFFKEVIAPMLNDYAGNAQLVFKNYFMPTATQALSAALASECANEQGKFLPYAEKLYATQATWGGMKDATKTLETYASQLGLNSADFNQCLSDKKYQDKLKELSVEGQTFGVNETPSIFIDTNLQTSVAKYDDIKKIIDEQLAE